MRGLIIIASFLSISACQPNTKEGNIYEGMDRQTAVKMKQYYLQGAKLYQAYCINCHKEDGKGMGKLIPPLAQSDYLLSNLNESVCIIKNGQKGSIVVNGIEYNQPMPPHLHLSAIEIAEIMTYITNTWGNRMGLSDVKKIDGILRKECE